MSQTNILMIDADLVQLEKTKVFLQNAGYSVSITQSGNEALNLLTEKETNLILIDLVIHDKASIEVMRALRSKEGLKDIPILVTSQDVSEEIVVAVLSEGADDLISKPISMAQLLPKIQNHIELASVRKKMKEMNAQLIREKRILSRYFSMELIEKILNEEISPELGGQKIVASSMFIDIRNSTGIAERLDPSIFSDFISKISSDLIDIIFQHRGAVIKFTGDGLLASFGCPVSTDQDARASVLCAYDIQKYVIDYNQKLPDFLPGGLHIGIGIARGEIFAGNIGSEQHMEYTVLGDSVNLAARLQSFTKKLNTTVLMDKETLEHAKDLSYIERVGFASVRGKTEQVELFKIKEIGK